MRIKRLQFPCIWETVSRELQFAGLVCFKCAEDDVVELTFDTFVLEDENCWYDRLSLMAGDLKTETYPDE